MTERRATDVALSRRKALLALGGVGVATALFGSASTDPTTGAGQTGSDDGVATPARIATVTAAAEIVYPPSVGVDEVFVERHVFGRVGATEDHFEQFAAVVDTVDREARLRFGSTFASLPKADRRRVLAGLGTFAVNPNRDGTTAERVRFYLVNDLLYALFTRPRGGRLIGVENPPGYPGGNELYQRGPER
jgi:hypothetical protein